MRAGPEGIGLSESKYCQATVEVAVIYIAGTPFERGVPVSLILSYLLGQFFDDAVLGLLFDFIPNAWHSSKETDSAGWMYCP